jgi:DNA polymerase
MLAFAIEDEDPRLWLRGDPFPETLRQHIIDGGTLCAWNVMFERNIWRRIMQPRFGWPHVPDDQWTCTMARALYWGLPAKLEFCAAALKLPIQKDQVGTSLMMKMAGPLNTRAREADPSIPPEWDDDPDHLARLAAYCCIDVEVERAIQRRLAPLPDRERAIWLLDQEMNQTGIRIDLDLVAKLVPLAAETSAGLHQLITELTDGAVLTTRQVDAILLWLNARLPAPLPDLKKDTVVRARAVLPPSRERDVLDCRLAGRFASPAKLTALTNATCEDGRLRDLLRYYGAGRTGRWSGAGGSGVQLQNLPRPTVKAVGVAIDLIMDDAPADYLGVAFEDTPLGVVASCLRGCFTADRGYLLTCGDLAQIEARVLAWLAGQDDVLAVFRKGEDIYDYTAKSVGSRDRQLGKVIRLALGFGMGAPRFVETAALYGVTLSETQAVRLVERYRAQNDAIVQLWWDCADAMREAIHQQPGDPPVRVGKLAFQRGRSGVAMLLPSGRLLLYRHARLQPRLDLRQGDEIIYDGLHQKSHKWGVIRTYGGRTVENATQAVARDVMAEAMLTLHAAGHELLLTSHDEIIGQAPEHRAQTRLTEMLEVMRTPVTWAPGLPVDAQGFTAKRYRK